LYLLQRSTLAVPEGITLQMLGASPNSREGEGTSPAPENPRRCPAWGQWVQMLRQDFGEELVEEIESVPSLVARSEDSEQFAETKALLQTNKVALAFVSPRGIGLTAWNRDAKKQAQIRRRFMLLGQTLDGMRVWDIRRAAQAARAVKGSGDMPVTLQAQGLMAVDALYASLFEPNIAGLDLWGLPASHTEGPDYLNVLRILDLPETLAMARDRGQVHLY
jgi:hypothetical protein